MYKCFGKLSFANHNTAIYLRHGTNKAANQRLSPTFWESIYYINYLQWCDTDISLSLGEAASVHRLLSGHSNPFSSK